MFKFFKKNQSKNTTNNSINLPDNFILNNNSNIQPIQNIPEGPLYIYDINPRNNKNQSNIYSTSSQLTNTSSFKSINNNIYLQQKFIDDDSLKCMF